MAEQNKIPPGIVVELHPTVISELMSLFENYGGYASEHRLTEHLKNLRLATYTNAAGIPQLVLAREYAKKLDLAKEATQAPLV